MFSPIFATISNNSVNLTNKFIKRKSIHLDNDFKQVNQVKYSQLFKSKSVCSVKSSKNSQKHHSVNSLNRLSWLDRRSWSFKRVNKSAKMVKPELTIIFSKDAAEWDEYLSDCFNQMIDAQPLTILHERIEDIHFPMASFKAKNFSRSQAVLLILSPDFLDFIDAHAEIFQLMKLLPLLRTVVMLCGVQQQDISSFHRAALVSFDQWPCLVAKDQDKEFVISVIQAILNIIQQQNDQLSLSSSQFKLTPKKVKESNGKVFILLDKPVTEKQKLQVLIDGKIEKQVFVKWKNYYTLTFNIPDSLLQKVKMINITVLCDEISLGTRTIKCETQMSELCSLLSSVNSPYQFMRQTLGMATLQDVDAELTKRFQQNLPEFGLNLFQDLNVEDVKDKNKNECIAPTLLHFAALYGLRELTSNLLQCPQAFKACQMRNSRGLTPVQLAKHSQHSDILVMLQDFIRFQNTKINTLSNGTSNSIMDKEKDKKHANSKNPLSSLKTTDRTLLAHHHLYDIQFSGENSSETKNNNNHDDDEEEENVYFLINNMNQKNSNNGITNDSNLSDSKRIFQNKNINSTQLNCYGEIRKVENNVKSLNREVSKSKLKNKIGNLFLKIQDKSSGENQLKNAFVYGSFDSSNTSLSFNNQFVSNVSKSSNDNSCNSSESNGQMEIIERNNFNADYKLLRSADKSEAISHKSGKQEHQIKTPMPPPRFFKSEIIKIDQSNHHEYANIKASVSSLILTNKQDILTDYDHVPSGPPIPIEISRFPKDYLSKSIKNQIEADYDIPRSGQIPLTRVMAANINNNNDLGDKDINFDRNHDDRQIFV